MEIIVEKQRSRALGGTNYYRYRMTIPAKIARLLGLEGGERLDIALVKNKLVVKRK